MHQNIEVLNVECMILLLWHPDRPSRNLEAWGLFRHPCATIGAFVSGLRERVLSLPNALSLS